jgi:hypothetical protein
MWTRTLSSMGCVRIAKRPQSERDLCALTVELSGARADV